MPARVQPREEAGEGPCGIKGRAERKRPETGKDKAMKKALTILLLLAMALSGMSVSGETGAEGTAEEQARDRKSVV